MRQGALTSKCSAKSCSSLCAGQVPHGSTCWGCCGCHIKNVAPGEEFMFRIQNARSWIFELTATSSTSTMQETTPAARSKQWSDEPEATVLFSWLRQIIVNSPDGDSCVAFISADSAGFIALRGGFMGASKTASRSIVNKILLVLT